MKKLLKCKVTQYLLNLHGKNDQKFMIENMDKDGYFSCYAT